MSKIIDASCQAGAVTAESLVVPSVTILSQGTKSSTGALIIEGESKKYITSNATDIADLIQSICDILTNALTVLTAHDSALGSTQTATIALITTAKVTLLATKENLK